MSAALMALVYGLFSLDHFAVGPFLLSRPLVMGGVAGLLCGHPAEGLALGFFAECLWIMIPPAGGGHWDVGFVAALAGVWSLPGSGPVEKKALALAFLLAIPFAVLGRQADQWVRRNMRVLSLRALAGIEHGLVGPLRYGMGFAAVVWVLKSLVLFFLADSLGGALFEELLPRVTGPWQEGLEQAWALWPFLGAGALLHHFSKRIGNGAWWRSEIGL
ncbi:MAG: PTS sugar transporter subunit IIC [Elusimicrobia bacterium]|nr:PTS sugar transporter subunit IIC [Elusimicrobiota bacterium]